MLRHLVPAFVSATASTASSAYAGVIEQAAALPEPGTVALTLAALVLIIGLLRGNK
jgi:hypothetical protein